MRLLLAEDEKELSKALTAILKHNGYSVDAVYNGKDALDYLLGSDYDCAILDIMMPLLDGISVLKGIRHEGLDLPVIMLTAKSEIDDRVFGLDSGADDYVTKPFSPLELVARVKSQLRRYTQLGGTAQNENDKIYSVGGLRINDDLKEVTAEQRETLDKLIEKLEEDDDVQNVFHNMKEDESGEE